MSESEQEKGGQTETDPDEPSSHPLAETAPSEMEPHTSDYFEVDEQTSKDFDERWGNPRGFWPWVKTINNIPIAHRYIFVSFTFFLTGGFMALLMRWQLAVPNNDFVDPETYNQLFTMHGTTMMFLFVIPFIEAVANYFMPLLLGTRDLPYPRLTALAFWTYTWGGIFIYASFLFGVAPAGGWFAYVPMTNRNYMPGIGMDFWDIGLSVAEIAAMGAAAEIIVSILRMRAPGMALHRMPIFAWAMLVTAFMIIFAFTPLIVGTAMLEFDRKGLTSFFVPEFGGDPLLWQHIFWIFGHPEVYIMFIPAIGVVSQIIPVFARRPLTSYTLVVLALVATGFVSFGLWVHHMFTTGLSPTAMGFFSAASMLIAIPTGVQFFIWISTLWNGRPVLKTPLLFVIGFMIIFVIGGVTGVMVGAPPFDDQAHDSYFVVAHLHYVLIGGVVFPFYAGLYYWLPKITGRMLSERLGKFEFWLMFVSFHLTFFPQHISGLLGMPRRVYTYPADLGWDPWNLISSIGAMGFGVGSFLIVVNLVWSLKRGKKAGPNPWDADTLEWWEASPPPNAQFKFIPFIRSRHPLWEQDSFAPQNAKEAQLIEPLRSKPTRWRGALIVSVVDGDPIAVAKMPHPTYAPFIMSIGFVLTFAGVLFENRWLLGSGLAIIAGSLYAWFRPREDEQWAIEEMGTDSREDKLPLASAGPISNGWWGMMIFLLVWAVALFTLVGSYFYLGEGPDQWPLVIPELELAAYATAAILGAGAAVYAMATGTRRETTWLRRLGVAATVPLFGLFVWLSLRAWREMGLKAVESAYASAFVGMLTFQWLTVFMLAVMLVISLLWALRSPADPRGHATTFNSELLGYFAVGSWVVIFVTLYVTPRLW